ncbi:HAMP domain-containing histidine kinase [Pontibacter sp. Tf4]|uniref:sensor histidine kinase n=1 Tax=Pontibacter sp. Tf4 TaxID=2761620 RepID=UPI0016251F29|nr:HAMP domain-containing sensor histidine kinase [Pontibacter sp. Tf4]MBB6610450.1 HAMP domain-containing histidine kinase [Pontibacter sp. Tf4]
MKLYLFRSVPVAFADGFKAFYQPQNNKSTTIIARVWLAIALILLASNMVYPYEQKIQGAALYRIAYYSYATISALTLLLFCWFKHKKVAPDAGLYRWVCLGYSYTFAITCLLMSVAYQGNPINNMTMYLMGLMLVALLVVLELKELLILTILIGLSFSIGVQFLNLTDAQQITNQTGSVFILIFFFLLSRLNYSFRANNFIQLQLIETQKQELENVNKAKTTILGVVAHDLRGPFTNIESLIKIMRVREMTAAEKDRFYDMILQSCQKSASIINDLLVMARYEQDHSYTLQRTDLTAFVAEVHQQWNAELKDSRKIEFNVPSQPIYASIDPERFRRVLDNLLSNAVKFTQEQGHIRIGINCTDRDVLLKISDDGIGIPQDLKPHLFKAFSKASRKGVRGENSVGLGLNIVNTLVQQNNGAITVESNADQGTTFSITLPLSN